MDVHTLMAQHPEVARVGKLTFLFTVGAVQAWCKAPGSACLTWFAFVCLLTGWVASPGTETSIVLAIGVFSTGLMMLIGYGQSAMEDRP